MKLKWKIALPMLVLLLISALITTLFSYYSSTRTIEELINNILDSSIDTLAEGYERTAQTEQVILNEVSTKNITLAHSVAEIINVSAQGGLLDLDDVSYFVGLCKQFGITELNVVDAGGIIVGSNFDDYYGFDYSSAESTKGYLAIIDNPGYEIIEQPREDAISGNVVQYFGVPRLDDRGFVQIGFDANIIREFHDKLDVSHTAEVMRIGLTGRATIIENGTVTFSRIADEIGRDVSSEQWFKDVSTGRGKVWIDLGDEEMYAGYVNLDDITFLALFPRAEYDTYFESIRWIGILGISAAVFISVLVFILLSIILRPITTLTGASKALSGGDFDIKLPKKGKDEIGELSGNFEIMANNLKSYIEEISQILSRLAAGDLQAVIERDYVGEFATMKNSINTIGTMLNETMLNISNSSKQLSSGSKQIADGSHSLAQQAMLQSSSVEELAASVSDIAAKTKTNAEMAERAAALANTIKDSAEKGSMQMNDMIAAVEEINKASKSIEAVMKTIDDIAFQTNILALNAAVEAARAGQHGKGFAVVAEEVRSLATKSAEAAKDTESLIQDSIQKADLGARIAGETSASLTDIVSGINESAQIIGEIAKSSGTQSSGIEQIDDGIEQISRSVQMTSATARQSAEAGAEINNEAVILNGMISQFKLKNGRHDALNSASGSGFALPEKTQHIYPGKSQEAKKQAAAKTPSIVWSDEWNTGNTTIDSQHRTLIDAINDLMAACSSGHGRTQIESTMDFLSEYVAKHFGDEEDLQRQYKYPDRVNHKKYHDSFKKTVAEVAQQLKTEGASIALVSKVNGSVGGWLINHIKTQDTKVAAHIRSAE